MYRSKLSLVGTSIMREKVFILSCKELRWEHFVIATVGATYH